MRKHLLGIKIKIKLECSIFMFLEQHLIALNLLFGFEKLIGLFCLFNNVMLPTVPIRWRTHISEKTKYYSNSN